jgi:hypothetical protein
MTAGSKQLRMMPWKQARPEDREGQSWVDRVRGRGRIGIGIGQVSTCHDGLFPSEVQAECNDGKEAKGAQG